MMKNLLSKIFFVSLVLACTGSRAQQFHHGVQIPKVEKAGYYTVLLPPDVYSVANKKRTNLRVFDDSAEETPFMLFAMANAQQKLVPVPVKFRYFNNAAHFDVILDPSERTELYQLVFTVNNAVSAENLTADIYEINGDWAREGEERNAPASNLTTWTERGKNIMLQKGNADNEFKINYSGPTFTQPFRVVIKGIDIKNQLKSATFDALRLDESTMYRLDSLSYTIAEDAANKATIIKGSLPYPSFLSVIKLDIDSSKFYQREATISTIEKKRKGLFGSRDQGVSSQTLASGRENIFMLDYRLVHEFEIYIHNNDNTPLHINGIKAYAPPTYIMAWLEPGKTYTVKAGSESMRAPRYDMQYNSDIKIADTLVIHTPFVPLQEETGGNTKTILLWLTLGLCVLVLGGMAFSMIKKEKVVAE